MICKLINKTPRVDESILERVLKNRKINDVKAYIETPSDCETPYEVLINIAQVCDILTEKCIWAKTPEKVLILVDCDVDGLTSSAILYRYLKAVRPDVEIELVHHEGKQHGLSPDVIDIIRNSDAKLVLIPDASSNDYKEHELLSNEGKTLIIIDHHESESFSEHAIVVNNELSPAYKGSISGAGVVYKVCQALDDYIGFEEHEKVAHRFLDLVALGNIGDTINLHNLDTRYLVQQGLSTITNELFKAIITKQSYSMNNKVNITSVGWYVAPLLNAVVRAGTHEEKESMFAGFISDDADFCKDVVDMCARVKRRQDAGVKKTLANIQKKIDTQGLAENTNVIMVDATGMIDGELIGLVANKLLSIYKKPIILLHKTKEDATSLFGSSRAPRSIENFKLLCSKTNSFIFCEGHGNAFGLGIEESKLEEVKTLLNKALDGIEMSDSGSYDIDAVLMLGELRESDIIQIGDLVDVWGNGIDEPLFLIKGIKMNSSKIELIGSRKNTIKFTARNGFEFIKFFAGQAQLMNMTLQNEDSFGYTDVVLDIVCKFKTNEWMGNKRGQLEIVDFNSKLDEMAFF